MKHITAIAIAVFLLAGFAVVGTVSAQDHAAKATVPFGFNVGDTWVPAGTYTLSSSVRSPEVISIRSKDSKIDLMSLVSSDSRHLNGGQLVFKKYGDQYFLHEILCSACGINVAFSSSKHEKFARTHQEAGIFSPTDVYLALNRNN